MNDLRQLFALIIFSLFSNQSTLQATPLTDGDTVLFFGDSITAQGVQVNGYVDLINTRIQRAYPLKHIQVIGAGVSGNTVIDLEKRLQKDVLQKKPTIVVIYVGVNDIWFAGHKTPKQQFSQKLSSIVSKIKLITEAKIILVTPAVMGERIDGRNAFENDLDEYSAITLNVARRTKSQAINLHESFMSYLQEHNKNNLHTGVLTKDSIHLNVRGNQLVANLLLKELDVPSPL